MEEKFCFDEPIQIEETKFRRHVCSQTGVWEQVGRLSLYTRATTEVNPRLNVRRSTILPTLINIETKKKGDAYMP